MAKKKKKLSLWKNIYSEFTEVLRQEWENKGFSYEQTKEWIGVGLKISDADFAGWLRDTKKFDSEWVLNYVNIEEKRIEFQEESKKGNENKEINAQKWLDENYPKEKRKEVKEINC